MCWGLVFWGFGRFWFFLSFEVLGLAFVLKQTLAVVAGKRVSFLNAPGILPLTFCHIFCGINNFFPPL